MITTNTLGPALRRLDNRRRHIEDLVIADFEWQLLADPAPAADLETTWGRAVELNEDDTATGAGTPFVVVTWEV